MQGMVEFMARGMAGEAQTRRLRAHVAKEPEHHLLDGMPVLQPATRIEEQPYSSEEDVVVEYEHVEFDVLGLFRHGHVH
jgi:hypothetical protein